MAEMMGKTTGVSKGKGGSMHLADKARRFWGGYAVVGGHLPLATGIALADQYRGDDRVTFCLMGDGSTNIGYFHEAVNMAAVWKLPVVWVIENNQYGMGTAVTRASAVSRPRQARRSLRHALLHPGRWHGPIALYDMFKDGIEYARSGKGPYLIEAITYRYRGHSMGDPERYRTVHEIEEKKKDDPITQWGLYLKEHKLANDDELQKMADSAQQEVDEAVEFARNSPLPQQEDLYKDVYA
jgi:pyruvate dehydrogenase E1 component alpha subunit